MVVLWRLIRWINAKIFSKPKTQESQVPGVELQSAVPALLDQKIFPHNEAAESIHVPILTLIEGIRKGAIFFKEYTADPVGGEVWYLTPDQVQEARTFFERLLVSPPPLAHPLRSVRRQLGLSTWQLGNKVGLSASTITSYETFRTFPSKERAAAIAESLSASPEEIFPDWLTEFKRARVFALEDIHFSLEEALQVRVQFPQLPSIEEEVIEEADRALLKKEIAEALKALEPREQRVLWLRFGFEDGRNRTLEEVGKEFGVTKERIRSIEARALRKLRNPVLARKLHPFLE